MTFEVRQAYINLQWMPILVVATEEEQDFYNISFTEKKEAGSEIHVTTYIVRPSIWRHYPPGRDNTHKYMFILQEQHTEVFPNEVAEEYGEALNIVGVETVEEVDENA